MSFIGSFYHLSLTTFHLPCGVGGWCVGGVGSRDKDAAYESMLLDLREALETRIKGSKW